MSTATQDKPFCLNTVSPHLICDGAADAIDFYVKAFGATEMMRLPGQNGKLMHASVSIGDSVVMLTDECKEMNSQGPNSLGGTPVVIHLQVDDVDALYAKAIAAGATSIMAPADMFWGDRYGQVSDPWGHRWSMATHQRDLTPEQIQAAAAEFGSCGDSCESKPA